MTLTEGPAAARNSLRGQLIRFAGVGAVCTVLQLGLFAGFVDTGMPSQAANGLSLVLATIANTAFNRWWTFGISGHRRLATHHGQALALFAITWLASTAALWLLAAVHPGASTATQTAVVAVANALSTVVRFVAMRFWIFRANPGP
jgi:putative flippase GtrA